MSWCSWFKSCSHWNARHRAEDWIKCKVSRCIFYKLNFFNPQLNFLLSLSQCILGFLYLCIPALDFGQNNAVCNYDVGSSLGFGAKLHCKFFTQTFELPDIILFTTENQVDSSKPFQLTLWEIILLRLPQGKGQGWGTGEGETEQIKSLCESLPNQIYEHSLIRA